MLKGTLEDIASLCDVLSSQGRETNLHILTSETALHKAHKTPFGQRSPSG